MITEYETKILDIDKNLIIGKLDSISAKYIGTYNMRRFVYDLPKLAPHISQFIRLRDNGEKVTLTFKYRQGDKVGGTQEIETIVSDFDQMAEILSKIEFRRKFYQENKRTIYKFDEIEFAIDEWPMLPALLEVESNSIANVNKGLELLNLQDVAIGDVNMKHVYLKYGIDVHAIPELKFD